MNGIKQTEQKKIGRIGLSDTQDLVTFLEENALYHKQLESKAWFEL